ncbi:hypothetical protein ANCCAN_20386 [Ancylostoma caninum]|uniref:FeoB-associated Cys-rich membrane protein n=1 Tax=Ancylostoma caninum TaxID=29170 RepID=A0A368FNM6_ANCCA|nr:hypothetical protein ANCCAN_20386 [Ancylostoma caninum]
MDDIIKIFVSGDKVLGYFGMLLISGVLIFVAIYIYKNRGRRCSYSCHGYC